MKTIKKKNILTKILHLVLLSTTVFVSCCLTAKNNKKIKILKKQIKYKQIKQHQI